MFIVTAALAAFKAFGALKFVAPVLKIGAGIAPLISPVLGFVIKWWRECLIVCLISCILGLNFYKNRVISNRESDIAGLELSLVTVDDVLEQNFRAISECVAINRANQRAYAAELLAAEQAVDRARIAAEATEAKVESINEDVTELRGKDEDCRTLDDPLPDWFDDWLRSD